MDTSTPAASTPSGSGKEPAKKRGRKSDGDEDETVRRGKRRGGKANANFACPFYMFDKRENSGCRSAVFRGFSDLLQHFVRAHESPANSCDTCGKIFDSHADFSAHEGSPTQCRTQAPPHLWAREQARTAIQHNRGRHLKATWFAIYDAIFTGTHRRRPTFCIASAQDLLDWLLDLEESQDFKAQGFNNEPWKQVWQSILGIAVRWGEREEQLSLYPGQPFDRNHGAGSHLGSGYSAQQTMLLGTAQDIFEPTTQFQSDGRHSLETYPTMPMIGGPGAANPWIDPFLHNGMHIGVNIGQQSGLGSSAAQTAQPQLPQNAPGSTHMHLPVQDVTGHALSPVVTLLTGPHMFSHNPPNPGSAQAIQATAEALGQLYGMPALPQTYPQQPAQQSQMNINMPGSQPAPPSMLTGLNRAQSD